MILKLLISLIFAGAAVQKFTGKVAPNWDRWGYSRTFMYATGIAELVALVLFWAPGLELVGAAAHERCDARSGSQHPERKQDEPRCRRTGACRGPQVTGRRSSDRG